MKKMRYHRLLAVVPALALIAAGAFVLFEESDGKNKKEPGNGARDIGTPVRILPLGDSITRADKEHRSYRYSLWVRLIEAGIKFDFVGSMDSNHRGNPVWPDHNGRPFDRDHEGRSAWHNEHILHGYPGKSEGNLSEWLKEYTPDIALLHLGTNDVCRGQSISSTIHELHEIIKLLRADNPHVTVLLAKLIPDKSALRNSRISELNARIDGIALEMNMPLSPVIVVDQNSGFDVDADTFDGTHPNESGEEKLAAKWFEAIQRVLER